MASGRGIPIVLSGPSGAGKDTVRDALLQSDPGLWFSVSATTRPPRPGERDGGDYWFISREDFESRIAGRRLIEHAEYVGNLYGTPREPLEAALDAGRDALLVIEVQGASQVRALCPDAVLIFLLPPTWEAMRDRLRNRGTEDESTIEARLRRAEEEIKWMGEFEYVVINDQVDDAVAAIQSIRRAEGCKRTRRLDDLAERGLLR